MAQILKGAPVVAAMNEANAARCAALKEKGIVPTLAVVTGRARRMTFLMKRGSSPGAVRLAWRCGSSIWRKMLRRRNCWM